MMSIFERIATLTKAAINEGLNKLEDPVLLTGQYLRDLEEGIIALERDERDLKAAAAVLEQRKQEYQLLADRSEAEAVTSMGLGNEDAARFAVLAKLKYMESAQECATGLEETRQRLATLEANIHSAKEEHTRLKAKRNELAARARKAAGKASRPTASHGQGHNVRGFVKNLNTSAASRGFERMEDKITEWEAAAANLFHPSDTTAESKNINADSALNSVVDAELERIRARKNDGNK